MGYLRRKTLEWFPAAAVSAFFAAILARTGAFGREAWAFEGLCRELVAGTTEGRQALVGSGWFPPLPTLVGAPAAAIAPHAALPWAAIFTAFIASAVALYTLWRTLGRVFQAPTRSCGADGAAPSQASTEDATSVDGRADLRVRRLSPQPSRLCPFARMLAKTASWLACIPVLWLIFGTNPTTLAIAAMGVVAVCKLADWWESGGLSDLVKLGFAIAGLVLCGFATAGLVAALLVLLPLPVLWKPRLKGRFHGVFVLGALPAIYALLVWCLMGWLILGDGFYPIRGASACLDWSLLALRPAYATIALALAVAAIILRRRDSAQLALVAAVVVSFAWSYTLRAAGCEFAQPATDILMVVSIILAVARLAGRSPKDFGGAGLRTTALGGVIQILFAALLIILAVPITRAHLASVSETRGGQPDSAWLEQLEADVAARTPYGRIFVCGYGAPGLLKGERRDPFTPCLDPFLAMMRKDYTRQEIFLLLPEPTGASAWESVFWRYPGIYERGAQRLLYAGDYGPSWRLYELVSAPLKEQLQEWRER